MYETWKTLDEFPEYAVSSYGNVMNLKTELIKTPSLNQQGIPNVLLIKDQTQYRRSVALLVASMFIPKENERFTTPINLDGNRLNNHYSNLMWRPRWFAVKYHKQFKPGYRPALNQKFEDVETKQQFDNSLEAAVIYGLIDVDIFLAVLNRTYVFPTNQFFQLIDW